MTTSLKWLVSLTAATAVSVTSFASAEDLAARDAPTKTVKAWDLDLTNAADVGTLYRRLQDAALAVCSKEVARHWQSTRVRAPLGWTERCVRDAVDTAVRDVGDRRLTIVHRAPSGPSTLL